MVIKTSYVAMGYKNYSFFWGTKSIPLSQLQVFFFSLATEGLKTAHPVKLHKLQSCEKKQNIQ